MPTHSPPSPSLNQPATLHVLYYTLSLWHKNETIFYDRRKNDPINGALHLCTFFSFSKVLILFFPMASLNFIHGSVCHFRNKIMFSWLQVWSQESSVYILISTKGQLISIFLFGVSNFFQKTNKDTSTWGFIVVKLNLFIHFLGETLAWKNHVDFVWSLMHVVHQRR